MITITLAVCAFTLLVVFIFNRKQKQRCLQDAGIPVDEPSFFMGNLREAFAKGLAPKLMEWKEKYGRTFGYYEGATPVIVTSDIELLHRIFIRDFGVFHARKLFVLHYRSDPRSDMFQAMGERWKRLRTIINPTFSGKQMKAMSPLIADTLKHFLTVMQQFSDQAKPFDISQILGRLSLDVIGCCAFGININSLANPDEIFYFKVKETFDFAERKKRTLIGHIIPLAFIAKMPVIFLHRMLGRIFSSPRFWFYAATDRVLEERKANPSNRLDFMKLMMDAEESTRNVADADLSVKLDEDNQDVEIDAKTTDKNVKVTTTSKRGMTKEEIQAQCMLFLLAGYETTHTTMTLVAYQLALNPDIQTKVQDEIDKYFDDQTQPDYMSIKQLQYMEMVVKETLRMYPIGQVALTRECFEEYHYEDLVIKPGMCIQAHIDVLHKLPELWGPEDPELFIPERFAPDRQLHPVAWMAFGAGPRNCVGMRFAMMEIKMALTCLLREYTICRCEETKVPLPLLKNAIIGPAEGVFVTVKKRK